MVDLVEESWRPEEIEEIYERQLAVTPDDFRDALHQRFERRGQLVLTGSARHALGSLLDTLMKRSRKRRVLISSFNCRVVSNAVESAGLEVATYDFSSSNGRIEWDSVARMLTDDHLALIVSHFFGVPTDFRSILSAARAKNVVVIEDCAHSLGGAICGTNAGQVGDAAVFSFNYDKPISLAGGGALLINEPSIKVDRAAVEAMPARNVELRQFRKLVSTLRYRRKPKDNGPLMSRIGSRIHSLPDLPVGIGALRAAVGVWQLGRYDAIRAVRDKNAKILNDSLGHLSWYVGESVLPAYLKLRILVDSADALSGIRQCREHRIIAANSNWPKIVDSNDNKAHLHAIRAATYGLELPIHQNLMPGDIARIASAFSSADTPAWSAMV
jgi:dTDP-4-amino-4,6-dideoxygalactose transaminase